MNIFDAGNADGNFGGGFEFAIGGAGEIGLGGIEDDVGEDFEEAADEGAFHGPVVDIGDALDADFAALGLGLVAEGVFGARGNIQREQGGDGESETVANYFLLVHKLRERRLIKFRKGLW